MTIEHLIQPLRLVERIDHDKWHIWPLGGISTSWIVGVWAQVDGTHLVNLIALVALAIGSSAMGLYRLWERNRADAWKQRELGRQEVMKRAELNRIEVEEARRASLLRVPQQTLLVSPAVPAIPVVEKGPEGQAEPQPEHQPEETEP